MWVLKAAIVSGLLLPPTLANRLYLPPVYHNGSVEVENFSVPGNLDGFKMKTPANTTSFDFWYFDAFSRNTSAAINIVFFNTGDFAANPHPLTVQISGTFDNGTQFSGEALASEGAFITNDESGITGNWLGSGASFYGTNLEKPNVEYVVKLNSPSIGVRGTFKLKSVSDSLSNSIISSTANLSTPAARTTPLSLQPQCRWSKHPPFATSPLVKCCSRCPG